MKTLYLHIGQPKTGSSAIQAFLTLNRDKLRYQEGVWYPIFDGDYALRKKNNAMSGNAYNMRVLDCKRTEIGEKQRHYIERIKELFCEDERVLLSAEVLWYTSAEFYQNVSLLREYDIDVKIIVYLRRQDERIESIWNQLVKSSNCALTCAEYAADVESRRVEFDYYAKLEKIAAALGRENVIVRIYNPDSFTGDNSIYKDFMSVFGIEDISGYEQSEYQVNPSLGRNMVEIKRLMNSVPSAIILDDEFRRISREKVVFAKSTEAITTAPSFLNYEERREILDRYEAGNQKIGQEYLGMEGSPFPVLKEQQQDGTLDSDIYKDVVCFMGQLLTEQKKEIEALHAMLDTYDIPEKVKPQDRVIVYGGDKRCRSLYQYLKRTRCCQVVGIVDRRWQVLAELEENLEDPMVIAERKFEYILIGVSDEKTVAAICEYLKSQGIAENRIIPV